MTDAQLEVIAKGLAPVVQKLVAQLVQPISDRLSSIEQRQAVPGRDGRDGLPGPQGERGPEGPAGPIGPAGPVGQAGADGRDGPAGGVGGMGPAGADGKDGRDGIDGRDGPPGPVGAPGPAGADGIHGKDGRDGIDFTPADLLTCEFDGERTLTMQFARDGVTKFFPVLLNGLPVYRDVFSDGQAYEAGDMVTWGGSVWIAKAATTAKPNLSTPESRAWKMVVRGGKDGKTGPQGPAGKDGRDGKDRLQTDGPPPWR